MQKYNRIIVYMVRGGRHTLGTHTRYVNFLKKKHFPIPNCNIENQGADRQAKRINKKKFQLEGSETLGLLFATKSILNLTRCVTYHDTKFNQRRHLS